MASPRKSLSSFNVDFLWVAVSLCSKKFNEGVRSVVWVFFWCPPDPPNTTQGENWSRSHDLNESKIFIVVKEKLKDAINYFVWIFFWCPSTSTEKISPMKSNFSFTLNWSRITLSLCSKKFNEGVRSIVWVFFWCPPVPPNTTQGEISSSSNALNESKISIVIKEKLMNGIHFLTWVFFWCPNTSPDQISPRKSYFSFHVNWSRLTYSLCSKKFGDGIRSIVWVFFWCPSDPPNTMPGPNRPSSNDLNEFKIFLLIKEKLRDGIHFLTWVFFWCPSTSTDKISLRKPHSSFDVDWLSETLFFCSKKLSEGIENIVWVFFWCPPDPLNAIPEQNKPSIYDLKESEMLSLIPEKIIEGICFLAKIFSWRPFASDVPSSSDWISKSSPEKTSVKLDGLKLKVSESSYSQPISKHFERDVPSSSDWISKSFPDKSSLKLDGLKLKQLKSSCSQLISKHFENDTGRTKRGKLRKFSRRLYPLNLERLTLKQLEPSCNSEISQHLSDGANCLNEMISLVLDSQPTKLTKEDLRLLQEDLKLFMRDVTIPFEHALQRVDEFQKEIYKRMQVIIRAVKHSESTLHQRKAELSELQQNLRLNQDELKSAKRHRDDAYDLVVITQEGLRRKTNQHRAYILNNNTKTIFPLVNFEQTAKLP